ncbi:acetolactate decarboxylase [Chryseobacterium populi]|uniref:Alpha-acetolactate decarboxylase n=1 Tax=Chryseobacterium populi TaxID=1144316 RepID=J3CCA6_9FLAO|nr:acetolactate decarboxylase [Chryseobacterium populi]EJL68556.1 alpha-acetolactate decarboxylase [Chryseobacterium populi]
MNATLLITLSLLSPLILKSQQDIDKIFHYSSIDAMRNGVYTGNITVKDLKNKGNFGLGTYHLLDGELIALNGIIYRIATDGSVEQADNRRNIPFASFTFFKTDKTIVLENIRSFTDFQEALLKKLPSKNRFYAFKIKTAYRNVTLGGAIKVNEKDTIGIAELMKARPLYKKQNVKGTMIGFYTPPYLNGLDLSPFHFHFLSDDKTLGGHLIEGDLYNTSITVELDEKNAYEVVLPDNNQGYQREWKPTGTKSQY